MSRMRFSLTGLSTTTTSSGLLDEARTRPQLPSATVTRTPFTVTRSRIGCPAAFSPFFCIASKCFTTASTMPYLASSAQCGDMVGDDMRDIFCLVAPKLTDHLPAICFGAVFLLDDA